jgi:hypothetical protein
MPVPQPIHGNEHRQSEGGNGGSCGIFTVRYSSGNVFSWPEVRITVSVSNQGSGDLER